MKRNKEVSALRPLIQAATNIQNPYIEKAKAAGKKIVGYLYQETPVEILTAAGCVPYFIRGTGSEGTEMAEAYFRHLTCNYVRHTFNQILDGQYKFLDGAVLYNACDHARRIYDNWLTLPNSPAFHFIYIPKKRGDLAKGLYTEEIQKFVEATEKKFNVKITPEKLEAAIKLHNKVRELQHQLYEMQKGEKVYLTGTELILVMLAGVSLPAEDYIELLTKLIAELKENDETFAPKVRLLYTGGHADSIEFFELLEGQGANIVVDNLGFGSRLSAKTIKEDGDPLTNIINYYFDEMPAATRQFDTRHRHGPRLEY